VVLHLDSGRAARRCFRHNQRHVDGVRGNTGQGQGLIPEAAFNYLIANPFIELKAQLERIWWHPGGKTGYGMISFIGNICMPWRIVRMDIRFASRR
jgi:hypothetical protein